MADPKVKTVATCYIIKVNGEVSDRKPSLKDARWSIKNMPVNAQVDVVHIVKQTTTETLLDTYESKTTRVLVACELDDELNLNDGDANG